MARIVLDSTKCTGCRVCEAVCSLFKEGEFNPEKARGRILRTVQDGLKLLKVRVYCLQCEVPYCKAVCPAGAIRENDQGAKVVDANKCIGCKLCEMACPVGAVSVHPDTQVAMKCDLCDGLDEPKCVKYCWAEALQYVPSERAGVALARAKSEKFMELAGKEM